jgi:hypothetical protein
MATRVASNDNGNGNGGKSNGNRDKGGGQATTREMGRQQLWRVTMRAMAMTMRVVSNKEGEGSKAMAMVTKVVCKQWQLRQRGSGDGNVGGGQG